MKNVLLVCGAGMSSSFMARAIQKAADSHGYSFDVIARSESETDDYIEDMDILLVCPHTKHLMDSLKEIAEPYEVPVLMIDQNDYGNVDGESVLKKIVDVIGAE